MPSIDKGVWTIDQVRDQIVSNEWTNYSYLDDPGSLYSWGCFDFGGAVFNNRDSVSSPTQVPGTNWVSIGGVGCARLGLKSDGTLWGWGGGDYGELAQNSLVIFSSPVQIPGTNWTREFATTNGGSAYAIKEDNTLWVWGSNAYGQLGVTSKIPYSSPIQIPGSWCYITAAACSAMGIKTNGTMWAWGKNLCGELGINNRSWVSSPAQIPGTNWCCVDFGGMGGIALKEDSTMWAWSKIYGFGDTTLRSSPVQLPGFDWCHVSASAEASMAINTCGQMFTWGESNTGGVLGLNNRSTKYEPTLVPGGDCWCFGNIVKNDGQNDHLAFGVKHDGTGWAWGYNCGGRMGINQGSPETFYSSPVQIPGTDWMEICGGWNYGVVAKRRP